MKVEGFTAQALGNQLQLDAFLAADMEGVDVMEDAEHFLVGIAQCTQQNADRQLAPAIDTGKQAVLGVEFKIEPGAAVGNDARRVQQLARDRKSTRLNSSH